MPKVTVERVESVIKGRSYLCPDVQAIDDWIRDLSVRIASAPDQDSTLVICFRADQDALIERRQQLLKQEI